MKKNPHLNPNINDTRYLLLKSLNEHPKNLTRPIIIKVTKKDIEKNRIELSEKLDISKNYLINGDSIACMRLKVPDHSVDLILCDLPYGVLNLKNEETDWDIPLDYEELWNEYLRVLRPGGNVVLFGMEPFGAELIKTSTIPYKYDIIWTKTNISNQQIVNIQPLRAHESIYIFYTTESDFNAAQRKKMYDVLQSGLKNSALSLGEINAKTTITTKTLEACLNENFEEFKRPYRNQYNQLKELLNLKEEFETFSPADKKIFVKPTFNPQMQWKYHSDLGIPNAKNKSMYPKTYVRFGRDAKGFHPTQKPVDLLKYLIQTYSNTGEMILDNTAGSCSLASAAILTNRRYICIEGKEKYFNLGVERVNNQIAYHNSYKIR